MFLSLFLKECKQLLQSKTYRIVMICMVIYYLTQLEDFKMIEKPLPGQENYGITYSRDETIIMQKAINALALEYTLNDYTTYPAGFYKKVRLDNKKRSQMSTIISEVTGLKDDTIVKTAENYLANSDTNTSNLSINISDTLTYEYFLDLMEKADKLLGGGSCYSSNFLFANARIPMTYEMALEQYNSIVEKDKYTGAYARLFSDYMGIILAILPVFVAVGRCLYDKHNKVNEIIYTRKASSSHIIISRYFAIIAMIILPVILLSFVLGIQCFIYCISNNISFDPFAFIKYDIGWLLPIIMICTSIGVLITELTDTAIAILFQGIWLYISLLTGVKNILGNYDWNLIPRHNTIGNNSVFYDNINILVLNRITYTLIAILLVFATIFVYKMKRRGKLLYH